MKNIGIIVKSLKGGGAERAAANLSKDLSEKYKVYLLVFDATEIAYPYCGEIVDLNTLPAKTKAGKMVNFIKRLIKIRSAKKKYNFCATISFMPSANMLNVLTRLNDKTVISIRNMMSRRSHSKVQKAMISWMGKEADMTVSLSEGVRTDLIDNFGCNPEKVVTIYNSCDAKWFLRENDEVSAMMKRFDFSKPTLVMTGRLTSQKGQWHALRALAMVKEKIPKCQMLIFGEGELEQELREYAKQLHVDNSTFFMGYVKNYHMFLKESTAFLFPSLYEGLGNVLLEALACDLPIVSTNCPYGPAEILAPDEVIENGKIHYGKYGILIPNFADKGFCDSNESFEENDKLFAEAITQLLMNEEMYRKYKEQAVKRAKDFEPNKIKEKWFTLLEKL